MTPTAVASSSTAAAKNGSGGRRGSTTRYSILSDPRLSQLFALSSQLEALAQSIDVQPPPPPASSKKKQQSQELKPTTLEQRPELPPKQASLTNNNISNNVQETFKYRRLEDPVDDLENIALITSMTESEGKQMMLRFLAPISLFSKQIQLKMTLKNSDQFCFSKFSECFFSWNRDALKVD